MAGYERSATIHEAPAATYAYLSEPGNMPDYIATMTAARLISGDQLYVSADVQGRHEEGEAMLRADPGSRRLDWGREDHAYRGWLTVEGDEGAATSIVTIHLETQDDSNADEIERALDETMVKIELAVARA